MYMLSLVQSLASPLSKAEVLVASRHSGVQLLAKDFVALILGEIELIEAGMAGRKLVLAGVVAVDVEFGEAVHAFELLETIERNLASTSDELQQLGALFLVEALDCTPEPLDLRRGLLVVVVFGVVFPVVDVDVGQTRDKKFEFLFVED